MKSLLNEMPPSKTVLQHYDVTGEPTFSTFNLMSRSTLLVNPNIRHQHARRVTQSVTPAVFAGFV